MSSIPKFGRVRYSILYVLNSILFAFLYVFVSRIHPYIALIIFLLHTALFVYFAAGRLKDLNIDPRWAVATIVPGVCFVLMFPKSKSE